MKTAQDTDLLVAQYLYLLRELGFPEPTSAVQAKVRVNALAAENRTLKRTLRNFCTLYSRAVIARLRVMDPAADEDEITEAEENIDYLCGHIRDLTEYAEGLLSNKPEIKE